MLKTKIRRVGSSLVVTVPAQVAQAYDINDGDTAEFQLKKHYDRPVLLYKPIKKRK